MAEGGGRTDAAKQAHRGLRGSVTSTAATSHHSGKPLASGENPWGRGGLLGHVGSDAAVGTPKTDVPEALRYEVSAA